MSAKIIAENILTDTDFLSATEQEGIHIGQPVPASDNDGDLFPVACGDDDNIIADFSYSGTTTGDGDTQSIIDSALTIYGDDFFIGATVVLLTTDGQSNLVVNGGYDSDTANWSAGNSASLASVAGGQAGNCLQITENGAENPYAYSDNITVVAETQYRLGVYRKNGTEATYIIKAYDVTNSAYISEDLASGESDGSWTQDEAIIETPASCVSLRLELWQIAANGAGTTMLFDTVTLKVLATSESQSVTDYAQATGDLTTGEFSEAILSGTDYTLSIDVDTRDIRVELITGGDAGAAAYKWSHDGGTTYLGRDDPDQANWLGEQIYSGTLKNFLSAANGDLLAFYEDTTTKVAKSTDGGVTFAALSDTGATPTQLQPVILQSGRILVDACAISDDNGATWSTFSPDRAGSSWTVCGIAVMKNGNIILVGYDSGTNEVMAQVSSDGGQTYSSEITIAADTNDQSYPDIAITKNGHAVCAYRTNEDNVGEYEVKCKISTDGGQSWGSAIDVIDYDTVNLYVPKIIMDINGDLICAVDEYTADKQIIFAVSTDNGQTWAAKKTLKTKAGKDLTLPRLSLLNAGDIICRYYNETDGSYEYVRRGIWEAYSSNACPCAIEAQEQKLVCDIGIKWYGGGGIAGDDWTIVPAFDYAMENLISDSPSKTWRSTQDNIACNITLDMGANRRILADGVAFFGANVRSLNYQMNASDSWGSPSVDESVSFDIVTGTIDAAPNGNLIRDVSLMAGYQDHELKGLYLRATSGTDSGLVWLIEDNVGDYIVLNTSAAHNLADTDTFVIFGRKAAHTFTQGIYRYHNISITAQQTAEDYYRLGAMIAGRTITLDRAWRVGYRKNRQYDVSLHRTTGSGPLTIKNADPKWIFELTWRNSETAREQVLAVMDYLAGKNLCLIPDDSDMTDVYLVKLVGDLKQTHVYLDRFDFTIQLEEVL